MNKKEISRFGNLNVTFPIQEIDFAMERHRRYGKEIGLNELVKKFQSYTLKDYAYDLISNIPEAGLLHVKRDGNYTREEYLKEWEKIIPINEKKRCTPFFFINSLTSDEKKAIFESFSVPALIEFLTVTLNSAWKAYDKNLSWLTSEEKVMWDDAMSGKENEWSFVNKAIENFQESNNGYSNIVDMGERVKTNINYFRISHVIDIISSKRGSGQYKKKINSSPEMLITLSKFGINFFTVSDIFKQLKSTECVADFICVNLDKQIKQSKAEYEILKKDKESKSIAKGLSKIINHLGFMAFGIFNSLCKNYSEDVFVRLEKLVLMMENDFNYGDEKSNVEGVKNLCEVKSHIYKKSNLHPRFHDFYWVKEMSQIKIDAVPVKRIPYNTLENKLQARLKRNVEKSLGIDIKTIDESCFDCFMISKEDVLKFHVVKLKENISYAEIQSKVRNRVNALDESNKKEEWLNSFDVILQNTNILCYFYDSKMPKEFRVNVTENLIQRVVSESFKKNTFSLDETIMLKEDGWMRHELKQSNMEVLAKPQKIRKF